jgi:hypothetical protein
VVLDGKGMAMTSDNPNFDIPTSFPDDPRFRFPVTIPITVDAITPSTIGRSGANITVSGSGFGTNSSAVSILLNDRYYCDIQMLSPDQIHCRAPDLWGGDAQFLVTVNGVSLLTSLRYDSGYEYTISHVTESSNDPVNLTIGIRNFYQKGDGVFLVHLVESDFRVVMTTTATQLVNLTTESSGDIRAIFSNVPAGRHRVLVEVPGIGFHRNSGVPEHYVEGSLLVSSVSPTVSSYAGGQELTVTGSGFDPANTEAYLCNAPCRVVEGSVSYNSFRCITDPLSTSVSRLVHGVRPDDEELQGEWFSSLRRWSGVDISNIFDGQITTYFDSDENPFCYLAIDAGLRSRVSLTRIRIAPAHSYPVNDGLSRVQGGVIEGANNFTTGPWHTLLSLDALPQVGWNEYQVSDDNRLHRFRYIRYRNVQPTQCRVGELRFYGHTTSYEDSGRCSVDVLVNEASVSSSQDVHFDNSSTPQLTSLSPTMGTTAGGVTLTITGTGFGSSTDDVSVTLDGIDCPISTVSDSSISCVTGPRPTFVQPSIKVLVAGKGYAANPSQVGIALRLKLSDPLRAASIFVY